MTDMANGFPADLQSFLQRQHQVITRSQALAAGMTSNMLRHRLRERGPWQALLPGVYLAVTGEPTAAQREMAALLYGGLGSVITGSVALHRQGLRAPESDTIDVLIPADRTRKSVRFARMFRTSRMPEPVVVIDGRDFAMPARAVADAARGLTSMREVRALVAAAVQGRRCPLSFLVDELQHGPVQGSVRLRKAVVEVLKGIRSAVEADLHDLIIKGGLPTPMFNPSLHDEHGDLLAIPDAWWPDAGVAAEADSREWHLSPEEWERTMARHARMSARGILVLHFSPRQIRTQPDKVIASIKAALAAGRARPRLAIEVRPAA